MAKFNLYTYQFRPVNKEETLFEKSPLPVEERMMKKQDIFNALFDKKSGFVFKYGNKRFEHEVLYNENRIVIFRIANNKFLTLEENFVKRHQNHFPSTMVIIDNRTDVQHIAIEERTNSFADTDYLAKILSSSFKKGLEQSGLSIEILKDYDENEFWKIVNAYPKQVTMLRFQFSYPNLPRVSQSINKMISEESKKVGSAKTVFEFNADEGEALNVSKGNGKLEGMVVAAAQSGNPVTLKIKSMKKYIKTGKTEKSFQLDGLELIADADLFESKFEKIISKLNLFK